MNRPSICIAGKNRIAIEGLKYILKHFGQTHDIYAIPNQTDTGIDEWQPSYLKFAKTNQQVQITSLQEVVKIPSLVFISLEFDKIIRPCEFVSPNLFNLHFSLLPKYKGMYTSCHPILNGETKTGCTIHRIDSGIDTGDIIDQISFEIDEDDTAKDLYKKYLQYGLEIFLRVADLLIIGNVKSTPQSHVGSTYFSKDSIDYKNLNFKTNCTAYQLKKQLLAYTFRDFQLPVLYGKAIFGAQITSHKSKLKSGTILSRDDYSITLSTVDYDLRLLVDRFDDLMTSVSNEDTTQIECILSHNKSLIKESTKEGWTPLMVAAFNGYHQSLEKLLELGANVNETNSKGTTPIMYAKNYAESTGDVRGIELLIAAGADTSAKDFLEKNIFNYIDRESRFYSKIISALQIEKSLPDFS